MHLTFIRIMPIVGLLTLGVLGCQSTQLGVIHPSPLPQDPLIQVYTNHSTTARYTEPYRQQTRPGDDLEQIILDTIHQAERTIVVAVQEFRLPRIAQALAARQRAGVPVRVILEHSYSTPLSQLNPVDVAKLPTREQQRYQEFRRLVDQDGDNQLSPAEIEQGDALVILDRSGVARIDDRSDGSAGSHLMHHKFLVVDGQTVIVTSANWTTSDIHGDFLTPASRGNANNLLKLTSPELAQVFLEEFNLMWGDGPQGKPDSRFGVKKPYRAPRQLAIGDSMVTVQFSPTSGRQPWEESSNGLIARVLATATQSVDLALFVFSDQQLVDRLRQVRSASLTMRGLFDPGFAFRPYSEALDMLGISLATENCQYEPGQQPWSPGVSTLGVPRLPPGDLLHHKFALVDQAIVITGSHNWTEAANTGNDETLLVIENPTVAAHFAREFERLYQDAILGIPTAIQQRAAAQQQQCPPPIRTIATKPKASPGKKTAAKPPASAEKINLNRATQAELERLPGIGPALAKRIIAARQQQPFTALTDLERIPGMKSHHLEQLQDRVSW